MYKCCLQHNAPDPPTAIEHILHNFPTVLTDVCWLAHILWPDLKMTAKIFIFIAWEWIILFSLGDEPIAIICFREGTAKTKTKQSRQTKGTLEKNHLNCEGLLINYLLIQDLVQQLRYHRHSINTCSVSRKRRGRNNKWCPWEWGKVIETSQYGRRGRDELRF